MPDAGSGRVTIRDVARAAGVSHATVSRVINGGRDVSTTTRRAVDRALKRTGYTPNAHARRLAGARPDVVAFLHCVQIERLFADPNINRLWLGCSRALGEQGIMTILPIGNGQVDAALMFSARAAEVADLAGRHLPLVACGLPAGHEDEVAYVTSDDRGGARKMVSYLRERGRGRIATVTGPLDLPSGALRLAGYLDVVGAGDPALVAHGDYTYRSGLEAAERLLRQAPDLDAIFAASDVMAAGVIEALDRAGKSIPGDVAVAGFDDAPVASAVWPPLTTVHVQWDRHPGELVRQLWRQLDGDEPSGVVLPVGITVRASA
ncbi:LacI family DNA-binding transcriptional regulator [Actinoplanes sp. L3-i22]|uniref:LacI family DNA-binding transcriptional regulator n=1 Tax=Actinoplanes sp. L3-i22 TaxID=2836373 RepID=UPI001C759C2D|nr:LacI family DNA-binding transcriptional regulator [Actinoplanes sp. L3-i22]BCY12029.1 LacI family transcriptional regulator [Actinoplanes sp. L3-i22]